MNIIGKNQIKIIMVSFSCTCRCSKISDNENKVEKVVIYTTVVQGFHIIFNTKVTINFTSIFRDFLELVRADIRPFFVFLSEDPSLYL